MHTTVIITSRSRSLGYGWTTDIDQQASYAAILPAHECVYGSLRDVEGEIRQHSRVVSGGVWSRNAFFVQHRRVRSARVVAEGRDLAAIDPARPTPLAILNALRAGATVEVTLEDATDDDTALD